MKVESSRADSKLLIIDGHNLLFQMFYGMPASITGKGGRPIHGTLGFVGGLLKILRMILPTHTVVIFDGETGSDRTQTYPEYKSNRIDYTDVPEDENPFSQLGDIMRSLDWMGIKYFESDCGAEADDVIACYANLYKEDMDIVIASADTDFIQLVSSNISLLVYRGQKTVIYTPGKVVEKWGVRPECFAGYKSLIGDNADNIKGVPRIGPKTAVQLISEYGSAEEAIKNVASIRKPSIKAAITEHCDRFKLNLGLITLDKAVPLPYGLTELKVNQDTDSMSTTKILAGIGIR